MVPDLHYFQCAFLKKSIVRGTTVLNSVQSRFRPCLSMGAAPHHTHLAANHKEPCPTSVFRCFEKPDLGCVVSSLEGW